jgi:solute:Na+ symporter, SSS family
MVQRYLSAGSQKKAGAALVASGFVILAQFALFLLIGASLYVFYQDFPPVTVVSGQQVSRTLRPDEVFSYFIVHFLPTGVLGLVIAAIFSAAMGTLAGSLNSSASTIVNDLYRPFTGRSDERHLMRVSRALTAVWGVVLMAVAFGATGLERSAVDYALAIASFVTGILLGLFLLGIKTRRVGQSAALVGMLGGLTAVCVARFLTPLAWPWFALVGSSTVFSLGLLASYVMPSSPAFRVPDPVATAHTSV